MLALWNARTLLASEAILGAVQLAGEQPSEDGFRKRVSSVRSGKLPGSDRIERHRGRALEPAKECGANLLSRRRVQREPETMTPYLHAHETVVR